MIKFQVKNRGNLCPGTRNRQNFDESQARLAFTLVELIISMLIFTIFIGVVASTFLFVSRALREANEVRKVYTEARVIMDKLTQDIRLNTLDYGCYGFAAGISGLDEYGVFNACTVVLGGTGATNSLALISPDRLHRIVYSFLESSGDGVFSVLKLDWNENSVGGGGQWIPAEGFSQSFGFVPFENESVMLQNVAFVIAPLSSLANLENSTQFQPSVHVEIDARSRSSRLPESIQVSLKTTVSSRVYSFF